MKTLRADQQKAVDDVREAMRKTRRVVLQFPTGAGKTVVAADIISKACGKGKRAMITVPALSLVDQSVEALYAHGVHDIGVIQAAHHLTNYACSVQVASVQTLVRRAQIRMPDEVQEVIRYDIDKIPEVDVLIVDECHRWFHLFGHWFANEKWRKVPIIGLSATPWYKGLGSYFDTLIVGNTISKMIEEKTLAPFRVFAASHPDLEGVRSRRDATGELDYVEDDLAERMNRPKLVADVVESWKQLGENRPTICFAVNRDHAAHLARQFEESGVPSGYMDCETPEVDRKEIKRKLLSGMIRVVCNVDVLGLGCDWPEISCISMCRPTRSEMRHVQNIGRGLRIAASKQDLIVIDHSDTTLRLGFVSDIHHEELDDGRPKINGAKPCELPKECPQCHYLKAPRTAVCPACGHKVEQHAKPVIVAAGTLKEMKPEDIKQKEMPAAKKFPNKHKTYGELMWYQQKHGKKDKWAVANYKTLYGVWPRESVMGQWRKYFEAPDMELASWLQSRRIAWIKGRGNRWADDNIQNDRPHANGHMNGNGHDNGALTDREQAIIDRVAEKASLMSEDDYNEMENFR
jgi:DNA repair protein RadD